MKKESKKKRTISFGGVKYGNSVHLTYNGYNIYEIIQHRLKKGWRNIPKHNKEWDDLMNDCFIPILYGIDKSQCIQKHLKENYENEGYDVEYDEKKIDKELDDLWNRFIQL